MKYKSIQSTLSIKHCAFVYLLFRKARTHILYKCMVSLLGGLKCVKYESTTNYLYKA